MFKLISTLVKQKFFRGSMFQLIGLYGLSLTTSFMTDCKIQHTPTNLEIKTENPAVVRFVDRLIISRLVQAEMRVRRLT